MTFSIIELGEYNQKLGITPSAIPVYLDDLINFYENDYPRIIEYFSGKTSEIKESHFRELQRLIGVYDNISNKIQSNNNVFTTYLDWEISDFLEDTGTELLFATKVSKFLRSTLTNYKYTNSIEFEHTTATGETLEEVSRLMNGSDDYNNDWIDVAIRNNLSEIDYDTKGGEKLKLSVNLTSRTSNIRGVVDNINGKKILGRDIRKKLTWLNDDLDSLGYDETANQSVSILADLQKGDIPEFRDLGRTPIVGSNKNSLSYTTTIREMSRVFSSDDTLTGFSIIDIKNIESDVELHFTVSTRGEEIINQNIRV